MPILQGQCTVFKYNLIKGLENFNTGTPYIYKVALYDGNANLDSSTITYTTVNEVTGTGYSPGGKPLNPIIGYDNSTNTAFISFDNVTWSLANFATYGALIYNSTTNAAVAILNFGGIKIATNTFTITFPVADTDNAVIRIT
jgi:hypothetical protein